MSPGRFPDLSSAPDEFVASVGRRLRAGRPVRRSVPGGWLHIDRPLPFLCVYRCPPDEAVEGADSLVLSQASHLSVSGDPALAETVSRLVGEIGCLSDRYGAFLVLELWADPEADSFRIHAPPTEPASTVAALAESLKHVDVFGNPAEVDTVADPAPAPPGRPPLLSPADQRAHGVLLLGLEVPGFFLDRERRPYPGVLRRLQHDLASAVRRAVFEFTVVQTSFRPEDFRALGPRRLLKATRHADRRLAEIADQIDLLLAVTPVNADSAWAGFRDAGFRSEPTFHYRPLAVDPDLLKRALYNVPLERVEDPTLVGIFRAQRQALDRQVTMLEYRGSDAFLPASLQLYGGTDDALFELAETILARLRAGDTASSTDCESAPAPCLDAHAFAARARDELRHYEEVVPDLSEAVEVRDDVPGVLVAQGRLLVGAGVQIPEIRADALVQHEVGTHIVTLVNGYAQPLRLLHVGLAGYEETQEGLAVLAEYVTGGLTAGRLTTLAARVVAVHHLIAGATFTETFHHLHEGHGLPPRLAFRVTMRVYRSGGLTKDAIYLRGLDRVLRHLAEGQPIEPLLVGKIPLDYVPVIQELQWRGASPPPASAPGGPPPPPPAAAPVAHRRRLRRTARRRPQRARRPRSLAGGRHMKLGIFVNDATQEKAVYTTTRVARAAAARGHQVWYIGAGDFACDPDDALRAQAWRAPEGAADRESFLEGREPERITVDDLDVLWLRNDPADDVPDRLWAQTAGILFGGLAARRGVTVLNDPTGLSLALTKLYLNHFPTEVRPETLITRDCDDVCKFVAERDGRAVLKPLQGSGGHGVFVVHPDDDVNLEQMVEAVTRDGYLIAQEYMPEAGDGDVRLFLLNGEPLQVDGAYAAFRRVPAEGEARANMSAGATSAPAEVDDDMLRLAELVKPRLLADGMFLVGLDIVGTRLLEINVFSPGGFGSAEQVTGVDFTAPLIDALEEKARDR